MSKITFRADDDLIAQLEEFDASKSAIMREALRSYLEDPVETSDSRAAPDAGIEIDRIVRERVDELITERPTGAFTRSEPQDINVNITVDGEHEASLDNESSQSTEKCKTRTTPEDESEAKRKQCSQCGEPLSEPHVYCPNCGEKSSRRVFCDCGDEIRSDWSFCPSCGRRTPAADVLDQT